VSSLARKSDEDELVEAAARYYADPLGFVMYAYPWGEPGALEDHAGPDKWQREFLAGIGAEIKTHTGPRPYRPVRRAVSSGHGIGKSTVVAWLVNWIMATRPAAKGKITANTFNQLETVTWAAIQTWTKRCIFAHWFVNTSSMIYAVDRRNDWFATPVSSKEENSEAFAGQHNQDSTSFYVFDEDSAIPDVIHEVAEGGLTDGQPMIFCFGNPTRSHGHFHRACFGTGRELWKPTVVDSRDSKFTNKEQIAEWIKDYGEDSDFVRVRVRGLPPRASELQFIDQGRVYESQRRPLPDILPDEPLIAGVDVSDGGSAWNVVRFRRGSDARTIPPIRIPGEKVRGDRGPFLGKLADVLSAEYDGRKVAMMFVDSAFGAPYVERLKTMGFSNVSEVRFGSESLDQHQANLRAYMWNKLKEWLQNGAIDPKDQKLEIDLTAPGYHINRQDKLVIESKEDMQKRGVDSPDDADALALTFAAPVRAGFRSRPRGAPMPQQWGWS
jgi:hypothetical protein